MAPNPRNTWFSCARPESVGVGLGVGVGDVLLVELALLLLEDEDSRGGVEE
jgi:hypothetical protein